MILIFHCKIGPPLIDYQGGYSCGALASSCQPTWHYKVILDGIIIIGIIIMIVVLGQSNLLVILALPFLLFGMQLVRFWEATCFLIVTVVFLQLWTVGPYVTLLLTVMACSSLLPIIIGWSAIVSSTLFFLGKDSSLSIWHCNVQLPVPKFIQ